MAKSNDLIETVAGQVGEIDSKLSSVFTHITSIVENYDFLLQNQNQVADNHDLVVANQNTIIQNLGIIIQNQGSIIHNQSKIVKNQAYLKTFLYAQVEILTLLTKRPKEEISDEINTFFENAQIEISKGFENPIGE
jgi:flagellar biosynthesis chaperone FliJ